jgi:hypothetical protein
VDADLASDPPVGHQQLHERSGPGAAAEGRELYGTTLIVAVLTQSFGAYLQIGDGDLLLVSGDGAVRYALPARKDLPLNRTDSLCQDDAIERFRAAAESFESGGSPALVLLSSDGYANSFSSEQAFLKVGTDLEGYVTGKSFAWVCERIEGWLVQASADGSGDDITLALAWNGGEVAPVAAVGAKIEAAPSPRSVPRFRPRELPQRQARRGLVVTVAAAVLLGMIIGVAGTALWAWGAVTIADGRAAAAEVRAADAEAALMAIMGSTVDESSE